MIVDMLAATVRARAKRNGFQNDVTIRTGRAAEKAECKTVADCQCSVRIAVMAPGVEDFLKSLPAEKFDREEN